MPDVPGYDSFEDPYMRWARAGVTGPSAPGAPPDPAAAAPPVPPPDPAAPVSPPPGADPYAAWAGQPVISPNGPPLPEGPITTPSQAPPDKGAPAPAPSGPITSPSEAPAVTTPTATGSQDPFGGDVNPTDRAKAIEAMTPEDRAAAVQSMTPDEFVAFKARRNAAMMLRQSELEHQANMDSERRAREDLELQRAAAAKAAADTKDLIARADALANTKIDPRRYVQGLRDRGHFGLSIIMQGVGGLTSKQTGGRNLAAEQFDRNLENDIAAQHADIANRWRGIDVRKNAIAEEYARTGDLYKAQETYRIAAYQSAINSMQSTLLMFDPAGGTAVAVRDQIDQFHAAQAQALNAFGQQQRKNYLDLSEQERKRAETASVIAKNQAETAKLYAEANKAKTKGDVVLTPDEIRRQFPEFPASAIPAGGATVADLSKRAELANKSQEFKNQALGTTNVIPGVTEIGPDGKEQPFVAVGKAEELGKVRSKVAASTTIVHLLDNALRIRSGYSNNNAASRKEWQELQQIWGAAKAKGKDALGLGALSGDDYKLLDAYLGAPDPTSFRDPTAGIRQARRTVLLDLNDSLSSVGYKGKFDIQDTSRPPPAAETESDKALQYVLSDRLSRSTTSEAATTTQADFDAGMVGLQRAKLDEWAHDIRGEDPETLNKLQQDLQREPGDTLRVRAEKRMQELEAKRVAAFTFLEKAANDAVVAGVRDYASQLLLNAASNAQQVEPLSTPDRAGR